VHYLLFAANHETVATVEAQYAAARAAVHIVYAARHQPRRARDVVAIVRVAAVDHRVTSGELGEQRLDRGVDDGCGNHEPDRARLPQLLDEIVERRRLTGALGGDRLHRRLGHVVRHALVSATHEAAHHVRAHASQADHANLHRALQRVTQGSHRRAPVASGARAVVVAVVVAVAQRVTTPHAMRGPALPAGSLL